MTSPDDIMDRITLESLKELLEDSFSQLIETYLTDSQKRIDILCEAIPESNFEVIRHEAHGLKGSSRNLGINGVGDLCEQIEHQGREEVSEGMEQLFSAVQQQFAVVKTELVKYL